VFEKRASLLYALALFILTSFLLVGPWAALNGLATSVTDGGRLTSGKESIS
jgi:hypothetical protein